jgi:hypothetical protein
MPKATNGADRGTCTIRKGHARHHRNGTCSDCGVPLTGENTSPRIHARGSGTCRKCSNASWTRPRAFGFKARNSQKPEEQHTFPVCGCTGILPPTQQSNMFAKISSHKGHACRVACILSQSRIYAARDGYTPIARDTPHSVIRKLMEEPNCWRCNQPLNWDELGNGKTPHLHHNHVTGEIYGFTCPTCNPGAEEAAYDRLYDENIQLKEMIHKLTTAKAA